MGVICFLLLLWRNKIGQLISVIIPQLSDKYFILLTNESNLFPVTSVEKQNRAVNKCYYTSVVR